MSSMTTAARAARPAGARGSPPVRPSASAHRLLAAWPPASPPCRPCCARRGRRVRARLHGAKGHDRAALAQAQA
eukprot:scaffold7109_cov63-Phaeocystis_antarctica.AAC.9